MNIRAKKVPAHVIASVLLHAALVAGLFFVVGVAGTPDDPLSRTVVNAEPDERDLVEPEIPEIPPERPVPPPEPVADPEVLDEPLDEPPVFEETDPADVSRETLPPSDLPPVRAPNPIGIGGGNVAPPPPPPPPPPPKPKGPTKKAAPKHNPGPAYPRAAADRGYEGRVVLLVEVLPTGKIGKIEVTTSSGHRILDDEAVRTVKAWHFDPALVNGVPARSLVEVPFKFELDRRR